jgi:hypothetical protein
MSDEIKEFEERIVPVWGLEGSYRGADPRHSAQLPAGRPRTLDEMRDIFAQGGMETYEIIQEMKRLIRSGAIELSPKNVSMLAKAEKDCQDVVLTGVDKKNELGGGSKNLVVQILNQITAQDTTMTSRRLEEEKAIELLPPTPEAEKLARFKALKNATDEADF